MVSDNDGEATRVVRLHRSRSTDPPVADLTELALQQQALQLVHAFLRIASAADRNEVVELALRLAART